MKRFLGIACLLVINAWTVRRFSKPPVVNISPPDVRVAIDPPPLPGKRLVRARQNLDAYKVIFDPYVIAAFALFTAIGSIAFALLTWQTNERQADILQYQAEVQASQALPLFDFEYEAPSNYGFRSVLISNSGGVARNVDFELYVFANVGWREGDQMWGLDGIPIVHHPLMRTETGMLTESPFRYPFRADRFEEWAEAAEVLITEQRNATDVHIREDSFLMISYQDFQGIDRVEYYEMGALSPYAPLVGARSLPRAVGDGKVRAWQTRRFEDDF